MNKTTRHMAAGVAALALGFGALVALRQPAAPDLAPQVDYTLLDGRRANTATLRGKVVLVNFWATTCSICVKEMPQVMALHERFKARGYETLSVSMSYDPPSAVVDFAQSRHLPFSVAIDNTGAIARSFGGVQATPTSVLVNKRGEIVQRFVGAPDFEALHTLVDRLLAET